MIQLTVQEMIEMQGNLSKTLGLYTRSYKALRIPTTSTAAAVAMKRFASISQNSLKGLTTIDHYCRSFQTHSALEKALFSCDSSAKALNFNTKYWDALKLNLGLKSNHFDIPKPAINSNISSVLERAKNTIEISYMHSTKDLIWGIGSIDENLFNLVNEAYCEDEEIENFDQEEGFASNVELQEALEEQTNNPVGFQEKVAFWTEKKKRQFFVAYIILSIIWSTFIQPYVQDYIGVPVMAWTVAHVKQFPEKTGMFVADLTDSMEATIVENVPYYYKVTFVDENGDLKEGYVSKRSVKFVEQVSDNDKQEEK